MIIKVKPDNKKTNSLMQFAGNTLTRLYETDMQKYPTNALIDFYDIIHMLMEALASLEGIKTYGEGAHKELIDYISNKYAFSEADRIFLQKLREFRNRISYEGFEIRANFIEQNLSKIEQIISVFRKLLANRKV